MQTTTFEPLRWSEQPAKVSVYNTDGRARAYFQITSPRDLQRMCLRRPVEELPRITSLLSPSHHLVSAMALDNLFSVVPPQSAVNMRVGLLQSLFVAHHLRKLYFFLCAREDPFREFHMREAGGPEDRISHQLLNELTQCIDLAQEAATILGGREHHPLSAVAGGVGRALKEPYYERLVKIAERCLTFAVKLAPVFGEKMLGNGRRDEGFLGISVKPTLNLSLTKDCSQVVVRDTEGKEVARFDPQSVFEKVGLRREPWTYEPFAYLADRGWKTHDPESSDSLYFVGPMSRLNSGEELGSERAEEARGQLAADDASDDPQFTVNAAFRSLIIEVTAAAEKMVELYTQDNFVGASFRTVPSGMGEVGVAAMESPSGFIAHRYEVDEQGMVRKIEVLDTAAENNALRCLIARKAVEESAARNLSHKQTKSMIETSLLPF